MADVAILVEHFAQRAADKAVVSYEGIDGAALQRLEQYPWPGNVRELRNVIETMVTLERGTLITEEMVDRYLPQQASSLPVSESALVRLPETPRPSTDADMQMVYRTLLQLSQDVTEVKSVLRHLPSITFEQSPSPATSTAVAPVVRTPNVGPNVDADVEVDDENLNLARIERMAIELALRKTSGSRRDAARLLGISERTLYRKIEEYGLR